jgi:hypothetical protein
MRDTEDGNSTSELLQIELCTCLVLDFPLPRYWKFLALFHSSSGPMLFCFLELPLASAVGLGRTEFHGDSSLGANLNFSTGV